MENTLVLAGLWGVAGGVVTWGLLMQWVRWRTGAQMESFGLRRPVARVAAPALEVRGMVRVAGARVGRRWPAAADRLGPLIDGAGLAGRVSAAELLGWKAVGAGVGIALLPLGLLWGLGTMVLAVALAPVGWIAPDLWLLHRRQRRIREIERSLSTVLDLVALSLEAGLGLERALRLVSDRVPSPVADEFRRVLSDVSLGASRRDAFTHMAERTQLPDIRSLTGAVVQADELGGSLVVAMRGQARQARLTRRRHAEAEALRAPVKMMIPLVLFTLPALLIVVLAPAVFQLGWSFPRA